MTVPEFFSKPFLLKLFLGVSGYAAADVLKKSPNILKEKIS